MLVHRSLFTPEDKFSSYLPFGNIYSSRFWLNLSLLIVTHHRGPPFLSIITKIRPIPITNERLTPTATTLWFFFASSVLVSAEVSPRLASLTSFLKNRNKIKGNYVLRSRTSPQNFTLKFDFSLLFRLETPLYILIS